MGGLKKRVGELAQRLYRALPAGGRRGLSAIIHGETGVQRALTTRARDARASFGLRGAGELVVGSATSPYRAEIVTSFDAHEHLDRMVREVTQVLTDEQIPVIRIPEQNPPMLVISERHWDRAWRRLAQDSRTEGLWLGEDRTVHGLRHAPKTADTAISRRLVTSTGQRVADYAEHIRVQRWVEVSDSSTRRPDGGTYAPGTLLRGRAQSNGFAAELAPDLQQRLASPNPSWVPSIDRVIEPVDIVYTWVDGSDPTWLAKRAAWSGEGYSPDSQIASRFESHDELRYSFRSIEMYANWFNRVHLVTDTHVPAWLDQQHPRLQVVDHRELFSPSELPVFNSHAIEARLHHIPGLAERFIYLNDDVFFGRPVTPELFFTGPGQPKFFPSKANIDPAPRRIDDVSVTSAAKNNRALLEAALGRTLTTKLKHTPHAHRVPILREMEERFPEVFSENVRARFRSATDHSIVSSLAQRYGAATGQAVVGGIRYNYADISRPDIEATLSKWLRERTFAVFCLNDTGSREVTDAARSAMDEFLRSYFPLPSSFEKTHNDNTL